ncbi:hypothetical protein D3C78_1319160 [compost metagenome]
MCGVVDQLLHLRQIGADTVEIALAGLAEHGVADIAGIERRIPQEPIVVVRIKSQSIEEVGRTDKLFFIGKTAVVFTRSGTRLLAQHGVEIVEQAVIQLPQAVQFGIGGDQIGAVRVFGHDKTTVATGWQRVIRQIVFPLRRTKHYALILRQGMLFYRIDGFRLLQAIQRRPRQSVTEATGVRGHSGIADIVGKLDVDCTASLDH